MAREWTSAQRSAIDERSRTLLVSAAAGSGKTAVLTERIIRSLTDSEHPADISRILVVTFTRAAAGELRVRIAKALSEALALDPHNKHLSRQLMLLGGAAISTIDSFYLDLVKKHFQDAGLPASFRMADENELISLREEIMNTTIDGMYADYPVFSRISDLFCDIRSENSLSESLISLSLRLARYPEGIDILLRSAADIEDSTSDILSSAFGKVWANEVSRLASDGKRAFEAALACLADEPEKEKLTKRFAAHWTEHATRCREILGALKVGEYEHAREALLAPFEHGLSGGKIPPHSEDFAAFRAVCDKWRKHFKDAAAELAVFTTEEIAASAEECALLLRLLHEALSRYERDYTAAKQQREVAEFIDVSRAAYRLLVNEDGTPSAIAAEVRATFDAVYIDEYQDVDAMQDATFRAISTPTNRFMVGDIKQSIYRFRGAQPAVFADYRKRFPTLTEESDSPHAGIFMSDCFRCDESVIRFTNAVSGDLFAASAESIGYTKEDDLRFSKKENVGDAKCQVVLIDRKGKDSAGAVLEARYIAAEIRRLVDTEKKADGTPIRYGDIAVLMRSTSLCAPLSSALAALDIPCNDTSRQNFFENADVLCVFSLLAALDNPLRDIYLAATLRSPFFGFSLDDLIKIRSSTDRALSLYEAVCYAAEHPTADTALTARVSGFLSRFSLWREKAVSLPVDRLLRYLYRETAILSLTGLENGESGTASMRRANLNRLYEYARRFESSGFKGLYQFVRYVDDIMENRVKMPAPEGEENAVSLITIHHSKGLEYPVCFLAGTASRMSDEDIRPVLLDDEHLGCALRLSNAGPFSRANTFFREAIARSLHRQSREEEMRVLYVALTRARERLYVTANPTHGTKSLTERAALAALPEGAFLTADGPSYIDWVLTSLSRHDHEAFADITVLPEESIATLTAKAREHAEVRKADPTLIPLLTERFAFTYPYEHLTRLPAKLSVSHLSPGVLDVYDTDGTSPDLLTEAATEQLLHTFERVPLFGATDAEALSAARGTATHEFLQFCRFDEVKRHGVEQEIAYLIERSFISPDTSDLIRHDELERFFKSNFFRLLEGAGDLHRETRFHIFLPASQFTRNATFAKELEEECLAVQGVIDLFFTDADGKLILCDYKTDRLNERELRDPALACKKLAARYAVQLSYYAKALQEICGRAPDKVLIYSLPLGEAVEIPL